MELLKELCGADSPSGREDAVRAVIRRETQDYADEIYTDALGNLIVHKRGAGRKILVAAHMDEIGVIAAYIDENGFIRFSGVGGVYVKELPMRRVRFENGTLGVIGYERGFLKKADVRKLYIDIGAKSRSDAEKLVNIGDTAVFEGAFYERDGIVVSKALDNRAGCRAAIEAVRLNRAVNDVYFAFTAQEEVGLRGARTAAFGIGAEYAVCIDVTDTGDTPDCDEMAVKLGKGAAVKVMDRSVLCHREVREQLCGAAKARGIPYQLEIMTDGGTDAGAVHLSRGGVKTGGISIPARYIHSPSELVCMDDIKAAAALAAEYVNN